MKQRHGPLFDLVFVLLFVLLAFGRTHAQAPAAAFTLYLSLAMTPAPSTVDA
jgi:hypothetical protein